MVSYFAESNISKEWRLFSQPNLFWDLRNVTYCYQKSRWCSVSLFLSLQDSWCKQVNDLAARTFSTFGPPICCVKERLIKIIFFDVSRFACWNLPLRTRWSGWRWFGGSGTQRNGWDQSYGIEAGVKTGANAPDIHTEHPVYTCILYDQWVLVGK